MGTKERREAIASDNLILQTIQHAEQIARQMGVALPFYELAQLARTPINESFTTVVNRLAGEWEQIRMRLDDIYFDSGLVQKLDATIDLLQSPFPYTSEQAANKLLSLQLVTEPFVCLPNQFNPEAKLDPQQTQAIINALLITSSGAESAPLMAMDEGGNNVYIADEKHMFEIAVQRCRNEALLPDLKLAIEPLVQAHSGVISTLSGIIMPHLPLGDAYRDTPTVIARRLSRELARIQNPSGDRLEDYLPDDMATLAPAVAIGNTMNNAPIGDLLFNMANQRGVADRILHTATKPQNYVLAVAKGRLTWKDRQQQYNAIPAAITSSIALAFLREYTTIPSVTIETNGQDSILHLPAVEEKNGFSIDPIIEALIKQSPKNIEATIIPSQEGITVIVTAK